MPRSTERCSVAIASARSAGGPQTPEPVIRIAPNPRRCTGRSPPRKKLPLSAAVGMVMALSGTLLPCCDELTAKILGWSFALDLIRDVWDRRYRRWQGARDRGGSPRRHDRDAGPPRP